MLRWIATFFLTALAGPALATDLLLTGVGDRPAAVGGGPFYLVLEVDGTSRIELEDPIGSPAFDAANFTSVVSGTTCSFSHTATGSNLGAIVGISWRGTPTVSTQVYGASGMTSHATATNASNNTKAQMFRLIAPATGAQTVTTTFSASVDGAICGVVTFSAANQTTLLDAAATADAVSGNPTVNVTSATGEIVVDVVSIDRGAPTVGGGQTQHWNDDDANDGDVFGAGSREAGASSVTMSWTNGGADGWALIGASVNGAPVAETGDILLE